MFCGRRLFIYYLNDPFFVYIPSIALESVYSFSFLSARISADYFDIGLARTFDIGAELGVSFSHKKKIQWYLGAGMGICPGESYELFGEGDINFFNYYTSVTTAVYVCWVGNFGMGFSFTVYMYLDEPQSDNDAGSYWGDVIGRPRITFGWKF